MARRAGSRRWSTRSARVALLGALVPALFATGCVERELLVKTNPPGAAITVDGRRIGRSSKGHPAVYRFDFYGTHTVVARRPGYTPTRREVACDPPWYQYFPLGLVADLLWPATVKDVHIAHLRLTPRAPPGDPEALARRAEHFARSEERRP